MRKFKIVYVLLIIFILGFSVFLSRKIEVKVNYDIGDNFNPTGLTTLYYDNGNDFEEDDSVYTTIDNGQVSYVFTPRFFVEGIRIVPTRVEGQKVYLDSIEVYVDNVLVKSFDRSEIYVNTIQELSAAKIAFDGRCLEIGYQENAPWPYMTFSDGLISQMNQMSYMTLIRIVICLGFLILPVSIGIGIRKAVGGVANKKVLVIYLLLATLFWIIQNRISNIVIILMGIIPFLFVDIREFYKKKGNACLYVTSGLISLILMPHTIGMLNSQFPIFSFIFIVNLWICNLSIGFIFFGDRLDQKSEDDRFNIVSILVYTYVIVCVSLGLYEITKCLMTSSQGLLNAVIGSIPRLTSPVFMMNYLWGILFVLFLIGIFGRGIGSLLYSIIFAVLLVGNIIKIHYHNTLLTPLDFLQIKEMFDIAYAMLGIKNILFIIAGIIVLFGILFVLRHYYIPYFKWKKGYLAILLITCVPLFSFSRAIINSEYKELGIFYKGYENEFVNEESDGVVFYNLINFANLKNIIMKEPDNYTEEYVENLKNQFRREETDTIPVNEKPNVILIMAESLFDIENIDEVTFNVPVMPTLKQYQKGTLISPRYGGYTSAIEYEALTGLTLAFYPSSLVPYTTYFNQKDKDIPSVAQEFADNGYETYAIHPNVKTFYNRDVAYEMLGFQTFLDNTAFQFTEDNVVAGQFLKDGPIGEKIISLIEENDNPVFAFAVTIAGHYMEEDHYPTTTIDAESDKLNGEELNDLEQSATAYHETDEMFNNLINYLEDCNEPTLVYVFGDHLPPLPAFNKLSYTQNIYNKYGTFLAAYSNYKDITFPEYITPNQLAPQMLIDSGIDYSSYYNYIYELRNKYPVLQKEFCNIEEIPEMEIYRTIQYDIMFGNQWFYEKN